MEIIKQKTNKDTFSIIWEYILINDKKIHQEKFYTVLQDVLFYTIDLRPQDGYHAKEKKSRFWYLKRKPKKIKKTAHQEYIENLQDLYFMNV